MTVHGIRRGAFCLLCWAAGAAASRAEGVSGPRVFTDVFGRSTVAEIVAVSDDTVRLRRQSDGQEFSLPADRLSDADRDYIEKNRAKIDELVTPLPETEFTAALRRDFRVLKASGRALEAPPAEMWKRTRYFLIIYGLADTPETNSGVVKHVTTDVVKRFAGRPAGVLWLGPSGDGTGAQAPIPEGDLKLAKLLPAGFAIIGTDAVARDAAAADEEIGRIAAAESPEDPRRFFQTDLARSPAVWALWRKRIMGRLPAYWPGCVYRTQFDRDIPGWRMMVVDRDGKPVVDAGKYADVVKALEKVLAEKTQ